MKARVGVKGTQVRGESTGLPPMQPWFKSRRRRRWIWFVVGSLSGFSLDTPVFPSSQKSTLPNSYSIWNAWTRLSEFLRTPNPYCIAIALHSGRFETCIFVIGK